jgi:uncharacterized protein (DUF302 family)
MNYTPAVTAYVLAEPFSRALETVRAALAKSELCISGELDVSYRIQRLLQLGFPPCKILLVDSLYLLLEAVTLSRAAAVLLPFHVVIAGHASETLVYWMNPAVIAGADLPAGAAAPVAKLQSMLSHVLEPIAMRQNVYQSVS